MNTVFEHLSAILHVRAQERPNDKVFTYLCDGNDEEVSLTYGELDRQARSIAARLQAENMAGQRVLLLYVTGLEFIAAFFGCLYAGAIAVPGYAPEPSRLARALPRLRAVVEDCEAALVLTTSRLMSMAEAVLAQAPDLAAKRWAASDTMTGDDGSAWIEPTASIDDVAFLQYTSGSTAVPKGVVVSHRAALANLQMVARDYRLDEHARIMTWVPFYHDMGLVGGILLPAFLGGSSVLMSPMDFLKAPLRWPRAVQKHRATMSMTPNFGLDLCVSKSTPEELAGLDLSSLEVVIVGAEPVRNGTLQRFAATFEPYGFRAQSLFPSYGLAEAVVYVSGGAGRERYHAGWFGQEMLERGRVLPCQPEAMPARSLVSCGRQVEGQRHEIVDPDTATRCPPGQVGEIWIAGPNVARGYWNRPEESAVTFRAQLAEAGEETFLRTGDLGFIHEGRLYVAGRRKDLIILRGRNLYPQDIELTVEQCHGRIRPSCTAAFAVDGPQGEALVVVAEVSAQDLEEDAGKRQEAFDDVIAAIVASVGREHEVDVSAVTLIRAHSIPKTSSGKIQRKAVRSAFLKEELPIERRWTVSSNASAKDPSPQTPLQAMLIDVWKEVLGVERVGVHDNFFALGGQSLLATQVVARLRTVFGVELPAQTLFEASTIVDLANIIEGVKDPSRMEEIDL